jgi:hypothetical protein
MWKHLDGLHGLTEARKLFIKIQLKRAAKILVGSFVFFSWLGEASPLGASIWSVFFAIFIGGGAAYLTWDDAQTDIEVLAKINAGIAGRTVQ